MEVSGLQRIVRSVTADNAPTPGLEIVTEAPHIAAPRPNLPVRVRDWIREHPVGALVGSFLLGLLSNVGANLITG